MEFCEIELKSIPKVVFSCSIEYENYKNHFPHTQNMLEISLIEQGNICFDYGDGMREIVEPGMLSIITKDMICTTYTTVSEKQRHTTVGVVADYECRIRAVHTQADLEELQRAVREQNHILLPRLIPLGSGQPSILHAIRRIAAYYNSTEPTGKMKAVARWFSLTTELSEMCLVWLKSSLLPPSSIKYVRHAEAYLREHYREQIKISDIADELNISVGYLQKIFADVTKMSIVQYINRYRVDLAKQYITSRQLPLREIAELVGVDDPAYMSRLFRKVTGMSYLDYLRECKTDP